MVKFISILTRSVLSFLIQVYKKNTSKKTTNSKIENYDVVYIEKKFINSIKVKFLDIQKKNEINKLIHLFY